MKIFFHESEHDCAVFTSLYLKFDRKLLDITTESHKYLVLSDHSFLNTEQVLDFSVVSVVVLI